MLTGLRNTCPGLIWERHSALSQDTPGHRLRAPGRSARSTFAVLGAGTDSGAGRAQSGHPRVGLTLVLDLGALPWVPAETRTSYPHMAIKPAPSPERGAHSPDRSGPPGRSPQGPQVTGAAVGGPSGVVPDAERSTGQTQSREGTPGTCRSPPPRPGHSL